MSQENPTVQAKTESPFGVQYTELKTDHNQILGYPSDWGYSILQRLAFSPRLEVMLADCTLWISTSALATSVAAIAVSLGVPLSVVTWLSFLLLLPVGYWSLWINNNLEPIFKDITGLRLSLVLAGIAIALVFGILP